MKPGYIYVLSNPSMPGIVKIGRSIHGGKSRARDLYQTGVPTPFEVEFEIYVEDYAEIEIMVHEKLQDVRVNGNREFFSIDQIDAKIAIMGVYVEYFDMKVVEADLIIDTTDIYLYAHKLMQLYPEQYKDSFPLVLEICQAMANNLKIEHVHDALVERKKAIERRNSSR